MVRAANTDHRATSELYVAMLRLRADRDVGRMGDVHHQSHIGTDAVARHRSTITSILFLHR